ncbi:MAG: hypothetical protein J0M26_04105 [Planctomycetes bacterium]|nr:hypothetical protein [Planctomycetota bacterium]
MKNETCSTLAKASALAPLIALAFGCILNFGFLATHSQPGQSEGNPDDIRLLKFMIGLIPILIVIAGTASGVVALISAHRRGQKGIALPAGVGIVLGLLFLAFVAFVFLLVFQMARDGRFPAQQ